MSSSRSGLRAGKTKSEADPLEKRSARDKTLTQVKINILTRCDRPEALVRPGL